MKNRFFALDIRHASIIGLLILTCDVNECNNNTSCANDLFFFVFYSFVLLLLDKMRTVFYNLEHDDDR